MEINPFKNFPMLRKTLHGTLINTIKGAWKILGNKQIDTSRFDIRFPDERLNRLFKRAKEDVESLICVQYGLNFRTKWLQSALDASSSKADEAISTAEFISLFDASIAEELLNLFFRNQAPEGEIPLYVHPFTSDARPASPLIAEPALEFAMKDRLKNSRFFYEGIKKYVDWLMLHKMVEEGLFSHEKEDWFLEDFSAIELQPIPGAANTPVRNIRSVGLNSIVLLMFQSLTRMANLLDNETDAVKFEEFAQRLSDRIHELMWNEEEGFYFDKMGADQNDEISLSGFLPLAAEIPDKKQAAQMVSKLQHARDKLYMIGTAPLTAKTFSLIIRGLIKYGYDAEAAELAFALTRFVAGLAGGPEYFVPRAVASSILVRDIAGFNKFKDRYVFYPKLPKEWTGKPVRIYDGENRNTITITLGEDGAAACSISGPTETVREFSVANFSFTNIILKAPPAAGATAAVLEIATQSEENNKASAGNE